MSEWRKDDQTKTMYHLVDTEFYLAFKNASSISNEDTVETILTSSSSFKSLMDVLGFLRRKFIPVELLTGLADVLTFGADKYGENNWRECDNIDRYVSAAMRHFISYISGEKNDPETGLSHLYHVAANMMFIYVLTKSNSNE